MDEVVATFNNNPFRTTTYGYDDHHRTISVLTDGQMVEYHYDEASNLQHISDSLGGSTTYHYDSLNRPTEVSDTNSQTQFTYTEQGLVSSTRTFYNTTLDENDAFTTTYAYDDLNRLEQISHSTALSGVLESYLYTLDDAGNRKSVTEADGSKIEWEYDDLYRLTSEERFAPSATTAFETTTFEYDDAGNRDKVLVDGLIEADYAYNERDQITGVIYGDGSTATYTYNARGNLEEIDHSSQGQTLYGYDSRDRLTSAVVNGVTSEYEYDYAGRRVEQTVGTQTTNYLWDEMSLYGDVLAEYDDSTPTPQLEARYTLANGQLMSQTRGTDTSYYLYDGQMNVRALTDEQAIQTDTYDYDTFGELRSTSAGTTENAYRFAGQQFDPETGLYSMRARYYDPADGRFLSRDTYAYNYQNPFELNRYVYGANNPTTYYDPSGHFISVAAIYHGVSARGIEWGKMVGSVNVMLWLRVLAALSMIFSLLWGIIGPVVSPPPAGSYPPGSSWDPYNQNHPYWRNWTDTRNTTKDTTKEDNTVVYPPTIPCHGGSQCNIDPFKFPPQWVNPPEDPDQSNEEKNQTGVTGPRYGEPPQTPDLPDEILEERDYRYLFRGTTLGFPGNSSSQKLPRSSTSSHPGKATAFAVQARTKWGGFGVVYIYTAEDVAGLTQTIGNYFQEAEDEIPFEIPPLEIAELASYCISVEGAITISRSIGLQIPTRLNIEGAELTNFLAEMPPVSEEQIEMFVHQARLLNDC